MIEKQENCKCPQRFVILDARTIEEEVKKLKKESGVYDTFMYRRRFMGYALIDIATTITIALSIALSILINVFVAYSLSNAILHLFGPLSASTSPILIFITKILLTILIMFMAGCTIDAIIQIMSIKDSLKEE